jgi:hypothetical protein
MAMTAPESGWKRRFHMTPIRMTRRDLLLTGLTLLLFVGPARAQTPAPVSQADRQAIRRVIESQLAAFQRDDGPGAFAFASPMIREIFATPENFMAMVKSAYQPVYPWRAHRPRRSIWWARTAKR